jgi:hypothetical protein
MSAKLQRRRESSRSSCRPSRTRTDLTRVQIAILDVAYALALRDLLIRDGKHLVELVQPPDTVRADIVVMDAGFLPAPITPAQLDWSHCIILSHGSDVDWNMLFRIGVRHVICDDCSPEVAFLMVLAAEHELTLNLDAVSDS